MIRPCVSGRYESTIAIVFYTLYTPLYDNSGADEVQR